MSRPDLSLTKSAKNHVRTCPPNYDPRIGANRALEAFPKTMVPAGQLDYTICIATWSRRDFFLYYNYWNCWLTTNLVPVLI